MTGSGMSAAGARATLPCGSWRSPVTAAMVVAGAATPTDAWAEGGVTWWSEQRPSEGGRCQVVRREPDGTTRDLLPPEWNVRTAVHEYGGGAWWVHGGRVFASSWADHRLHRLDPGAAGPVPITPAPAHAGGLRYADGRVTPDGSTVVCVRESHPPPGPDGTVDVTAVRNEIVALPSGVEPGRTPAEPVVLVTGHDFVAAPRVSRDGRRLAWLTWEHPDMPWDATTLWVADVVGRGAGTRLRHVRAAAVGRDESLIQPEWAPDGTLLVLSDRADWWNVHRVAGLDGDAPSLAPVHPVAADVGVPAWLLGTSRYGVGTDGTVAFTYSDGIEAHLVTVGPDGSTSDTVVTVDGDPAVRLTSVRVDGDRVVAVAAQRATGPVVAELPLGSGPTASDADAAEAVTLRPAPAHGLDPAGLSVPRHVTFPSAGGRASHAWFYPPASATDAAPEGELPPLVVTVHGGPTGAADPAFRPAIQFWTSRGFAVADVDYGGSAMHGRAYRRLLDGAWGVVDVDDACAAATWLAAEGLVDGSRMAIQGGSAGGFTTLAALATRDVFAAGVDSFGPADLTSFVHATHKFESRYLDRLVGPYPEEADRYVERSPLTHVAALDRPLLVLQGEEDAVVPASQSAVVVDALRERGVPHAYLTFPGEQHGFRRAESMIRVLEASLSFYAQVFGVEPADDVDRLNLAAGRPTDR